MVLRQQEGLLSFQRDKFRNIILFINSHRRKSMGIYYWYTKPPAVPGVLYTNNSITKRAAFSPFRYKNAKM